MKKILLLLLSVVFISLSCSSFIKEKDGVALRKYEKMVFTTLKQFEANDNVLKKGSDVKIIITESDEWIKVHAYLAEENILKAQRIIVLYLFKDNFKDEIFDVKEFETRLFSVIKPKK